MKTRNVAGLILYSQDKKILLQHRTDNAPQFPGYWGAFGGGSEPSETVRQTLDRELMEELEYRVHNPDLLLTDEYVLDDTALTLHLFMEKYDGQPLVLHEGQGYGWFTVEEALNLKIIDRRRQQMPLIKAYLDTH